MDQFTGDFRTLKVYQLAYELAMEVYHITKLFPKEELYSLTSQIRRSSRAVPAIIGEGYRKRLYPQHFRSKMSDADAEASETTVHLDFSRDCQYITAEKHADLLNRYQEVGKMLGGMISNPEKFLPK
ncbi:MAG: four helix bundle protein [Lewinellaceae bacterium]|jgi:four helix bundle protein|nr:four helix bundle protein [Lewinellaceae bacterium]